MSERRLRPLIGNLRYRFERQIALENCGNLHLAPFASEKKKDEKFLTICY